MSSSNKIPMVGVGLRSVHYPYVLKESPQDVDHFEVISENYMFSQGRPLEILLKIRERYPIFAHGVSMSVLAADGVSTDYLKHLKAFYTLIEPQVCTDHLCWTGVTGHSVHDLLPFPFNQKFFELAVKNISLVQDYLGRSMAFENLSAYMHFKDSQMAEWDFISRLCKTTGAGLLLDLNNLWVNATNFKFDQQEYLDAIPASMISQIHLGGPTDTGKFLFDTHSTDVPDQVWALLESNAQRFKHIPIVIERDDHIPEFPVLLQEVNKARSILNNAIPNTSCNFWQERSP